MAHDKTPEQLSLFDCQPAQPDEPPPPPRELAPPLDPHRPWIRCRECGDLVKADRLPKHIMLNHPPSREADGPAPDLAKWRVNKGAEEI